MVRKPTTTLIRPGKRKPRPNTQKQVDSYMAHHARKLKKKAREDRMGLWGY